MMIMDQNFKTDLKYATLFFNPTCRLCYMLSSTESNIRTSNAACSFTSKGPQS